MRPKWLHPQGSFQIDIADLGTLDFRGDAICFLSDCGDDRTFPGHPLSGTPQKIEFKILPVCVLLAAQFGDRLYRFDREDLSLQAVESLSRTSEDDYAFMFIRFVEAEGRVLVIYENGLMCLDEGGTCLWHVAHGKYGYQFERVEDDKIWYADADGDTWAYRLNDGTEARE